MKVELAVVTSILCLAVACRSPEPITGAGSEASAEPEMASISGTLTSGWLPLPPGQLSGRALDVNSNSVAVGYAFGLGEGLALRWTSMTEVTVLEPPANGRNCFALKLNERGSVLGRCSIDGRLHMVTWSAKGIPTDLGPGLPGAINERGDIAYVRDGQMFVREARGGTRRLTGWSGEWPTVLGMNNRGDVVAETRIGGLYSAVVLRKDGRVQVVPAPAGTSLRPSGGINDGGQIAGHYSRNVPCDGPGTGIAQCSGPWRWSREDGYLELEQWQPPSFDFGEIGRITNAGLIAGGVKRYGSLNRAVVWDWQGNRVAEYPVNGVYTVAYGLNARGVAVGAVTLLGSSPLIERPTPRVF